MFCHSSEADEEEESSQQPQQVASALVNSSPKVPRVEAPNAVQPAQLPRPESFDVTLQRKDNEGFGFVILTSKNKPPPGGVEQTQTRHMHDFCFPRSDIELMQISTAMGQDMLEGFKNLLQVSYYSNSLQQH